MKLAWGGGYKGKLCLKPPTCIHEHQATEQTVLCMRIKSVDVGIHNRVSAVCRLYRMVLVDAPWIFKGPWEIFKSLLGKHADLVQFASRSQLAQQYFTPETLPADFRKQ